MGFEHDTAKLANKLPAAQIQRIKHPTICRSTSCLTGGSNRTLAAMITSR
jgi:hypothetical protein